MTDMMSDVIQRGTATRALTSGSSDIAGKTGTTSDRRDTWFVGFNADVAARSGSVFDQERTLGESEEGGKDRAADVDLFHAGGAARQAGTPSARAAGVVRMWVSRDTGRRRAPACRAHCSKRFSSNMLRRQA
jgi:penicillin-binding protein 1A